MTIYKTLSLIDTYRCKAKSKNIHELNGRPNRPDLTNFIAEEIWKKVKPRDNTVLVDVGCGDASLLKKLASSIPSEHTVKLIGVLPTREELVRVKKNLHINTLIKNANEEINESEKILVKIAFLTEFKLILTEVLFCKKIFKIGDNKIKINTKLINSK